MKYVFDIDGTICSNTGGKNNYVDAEPFSNRIKEINKLYEEGNTILFLTARGMGKNDNNVIEAYNQFYELTKKQLSLWGVKFHKLYLGKPDADLFVDDKGCSDTVFFKELAK